MAATEALVGDDEGAIVDNGSSAMAKLSDFGAAFYYGALPSEQRVHFERMEQRAFGFLLEELLADTTASSRLACSRRCVRSRPRRRAQRLQTGRGSPHWRGC